MIQKSIGPGEFPDCCWWQGDVFVATQRDTRIDLMRFSPTLQPVSIIEIPCGGRPAVYPHLYADDTIHLVFRNGEAPYNALHWRPGRALESLTDDGVGGENPVGIGAGWIAWRKYSLGRYMTYGRRIEGGQPAEWDVNPTVEGLWNVNGERQIVYLQAMRGPSSPAAAFSPGGYAHRVSGLTIAEEDTGVNGVIGRFDFVSGYLSIWPGEDTVRPRAALGPDGRYAVVTTGAGGVRVAIVTADDTVPSRPTLPHPIPPPKPTWGPLLGPIDMLDYAIGARADAWPKGGLDLHVDRHARRAVWMKGGKAAYEAWDDRFYYLYEDHSDETAFGYGLTPGILYPRTFQPGQIVKVMAPAYRLDFQPDRTYQARPWWYWVSAEWVAQYPVPGYGPLNLVRVKRTPVNGDGSPQRPNGHEYDWCSKEWGRVAFEDGRGGVTVFPAPTPDEPRAMPPLPILSFPPPSEESEPMKPPKVQIVEFNDRRIVWDDTANGIHHVIELIPTNEPHARDVHIDARLPDGRGDRSGVTRVIRF